MEAGRSHSGERGQRNFQLSGESWKMWGSGMTLPDHTSLTTKLQPGGNRRHQEINERQQISSVTKVTVCLKHH